MVGLNIMKNEILLIEKIWENAIKKEDQTQLFPSYFEDVLSEIFAVGQFYYYLIDFSDSNISYVSRGFKEAHGVESHQIKKVNDIVEFIHPEDFTTVVKAEQLASSIMKENIGVEKIKEFKYSYNARLKTLSGKYQLYSRQSFVLSTDSNGNVDKGLVIHSNINHITSYNNKKLTIIGLIGNPSLQTFNICEDVSINPRTKLGMKLFSKRELQVIKLIANGLESKEIAERLFISSLTVKTHRQNILSKSGCHNVVELLAIGMDEGWI